MEEKSHPFLKIIRPGAWISVQDEGRFGYRHLGVPCSGAMDQDSYTRANDFVGNPKGCAALEIMGPGTVLEMESDSTIAFTGAVSEILIGDQKLPLETLYPVYKTQQIAIGRFTRGGILYLAVQGGVSVPVVMGSRSTLPNHPDSRPVKGVVYYKGEHKPHVGSRTLIQPNSEDFYEDIFMNVVRGPEYDWLDEEASKILENGQFTLTNQSNRMGFRLQGPGLQKSVMWEMLTSAVMPGTIQLLPDGQLIALMRDAQTTGGYPRILQITEEGMNKLAQKRPGESIRFMLPEKE